jgi:hypothetical protein
MNIKNNPFNSGTFERIWMKNFQPHINSKSFDFIKGIRFYKNSIFPLYINVGQNLTKGNFYTLHDSPDFKNNVFLIYDIPAYFNVTEPTNLDTDLKFYKSVQYSGFLIDLNNFKNYEDYFLSTFGKSSRMKLRKYINRLESCFDISSKMYFGFIKKSDFEKVFNQFMHLLIKRYSQKEIIYNNMNPKEWGFYKEVAYSLILEEKASLFVLYDKDTPIAITFNYHSKNVIFDAITVFDIDYSKFNLGYVNNLKLIKWCFDNKILKLDFSKGYFDYKKKLCTCQYNFEYHIYCDSQSIKSRVLAFYIKVYLDAKQKLRQYDLNELLHKGSYYLKNRVNSSKKNNICEITILEENFDRKKASIINQNDQNHNFLKKYIYDFQYSYLETSQDINVYKVIDTNKTYVIAGKNKSQQIKF